MFLCLKCSKEVAEDDPRLSDRTHPHWGGCPECGAKGIPADTNDKVQVSITWHELRCLVIWAERWAGSYSGEDPTMMQVVYGIADRLQIQHMDKPGLTFRSELAEIAAAGFKYEQNVIPEDRSGQ